MLNIVITGCSSGIGAELVKLFSMEHRVYGLSRNEDKMRLLKSELSNPSNFNFLACDIVDVNPQLIENWIGVNEVDVLINNAGLLVNKPFDQVNKEDYQSIMDVNFWGVFHLSQLLLEKLGNAKGHIVNISSMGGVNYSAKFPGLSLYSSSKGALTTLSECMAEELKPLGIRVNALALGAVQTEMLAKAFPEYKAEIESSEMAAFIYNFVNSSGNMVNGQVIKVASSNP